MPPPDDTNESLNERAELCCSHSIVRLRIEATDVLETGHRMVVGQAAARARHNGGGDSFHSIDRKRVTAVACDAGGYAHRYGVGDGMDGAIVKSRRARVCVLQCVVRSSLELGWENVSGVLRPPTIWRII